LDYCFTHDFKQYLPHVHKPKSGMKPMQENYTYDEAMVLMLYRELAVAGKVDLSAKIQENSDLNDAFSNMLFAKTQLPKVMFNPSNAVLNNILLYSTKTAMEATL